MENPQVRRLFGFALAAVMAWASYSAIRLAYADHLARTDSVDAVRHALTIAPDNANYWLHWVDLMEAGGQSGDSGIARATQVDPFNAEVWVRAGLNAEMSGDYQRAEQHLLRAARQSRQFEPRWVLANYYFRRNDEEHFWPWVKSAMTWAHADRRLLFELCWRTGADPVTVLNRGIPDQPEVLREYLRFLLSNDQSEAASLVAQKLEDRASPEDRELLLGYANRMLDLRRWHAAVSAWNALSFRKLVSYSPIDPARGRLLTNGQFSTKPLDSGFDWHIAQVAGVAPVHNASPGWLRFDFSGQEPETCNLMHQFVPVTPGFYKLRFGYRTEGILPQTGLQWKVSNAETRIELPGRPLHMSSDGWADGEMAFAVPPGVQMARVELSYRRQPGTVRIEGAVWLRDVALERVR